MIFYLKSKRKCPLRIYGFLTNNIYCSLKYNNCKKYKTRDCDKECSVKKERIGIIWKGKGE